MRRNQLLVLGGMLLGAAATALYLNLPSSTALAQPQGGGAGQAMTTKDITLDQASAAMKAAAEKAKEINTKMDIAIVDVGGNLKAFARMDGAWLGSIDISIKKAKTAR